MSEKNKTGARVLIVEDEGMVAMLLEDMLADLGHQTIATVNMLEQAAQLIAQNELDLAILDVNLNGKTTYPLAEELKQRNIPFIFATGYGHSGLAAEWRDRPVLQKPFQLQDLEQALATVLGT